MREAKSKELKKDIEILSQTFERVVDRKDAVIKSLAKDLMEAEEQYSMALRSHLQNIDNLIGNIYELVAGKNGLHACALGIQINLFSLCRLFRDNAFQLEWIII